MNNFNKISLCLIILCSSAHMFSWQPNQQQQTQEQREAAAREQLVRDMQRQMESQLAALQQRLQGLPTPEEFGALLQGLNAAPRPNQNNQNN